MKIKLTRGKFAIIGDEDYEDAAKAYDVKAKELHKEFASLNFVENI